MANLQKSPIPSISGGTGAVSLTGLVVGNGTSAMTTIPLSTTYTASTPYTVQVTDETVLVDTVTIAAPVSVLLLEAPTVDGQMWTVKDSTGSAGTYNITVSSVSSDINIDGATTFVLNNAYQSASFVWSSAEGQYYLVDEANIPTPSGGIGTIDGDSGYVTGSTVTLSGGSTGAVYTGNDTTTMTMSFAGITVNDGNITLGSDDVTSTIDIGTGSTGDANLTVNIGNQSGGGGATINIGTVISQPFTSYINMGTGHGGGPNAAPAITIGNTGLGSTTTIYGGGSGFAAPIVLQDSTGTNITIGNTIRTGTIYVYSTASTTITSGSGGITLDADSDGILTTNVYGTTVTGSAVLVDSSTGQLGTISSSARYKENIADMASDISSILNLRPVSFTLKSKPALGKQTGLIAEEVEKVAPSLVVYNKSGQPDSVKYHELPALLLNELQKALKRIEALEAKVSSSECKE